MPRMIERIVHPRIALDLAGICRRHTLPDDVVGVRHELEQAGPDDVSVLDERQLHFEAVRHRYVVGVHAGDHVEPARGQPAVECRPKAEVVLQRDERHRHRAVCPQFTQALGELVANRSVTHDDHLVRTHALVVDRAAERPPDVVAPVAVVHRKQEREGLVHTQNVGGVADRVNDCAGTQPDHCVNADHGRWYSFALSSAPVITVSGRPRSAEDWMRQYVRPLAEITTLATLRSQPVSWVTLHHTAKEFPGRLFAGGTPHHEPKDLPVQLFAADIAQQPYDAAPMEAPYLISHDTGTLIRLGPDGATLPDLLAGWQSLQTTYITFFDYLTTALRASMSTKSRFLVLVPALEGFHLAKHGDGPIPKEDFKKQRKAVLQRIGDLDGVNPGDVDFLTKWLSVYGSYQLADRLRVIVDQELGEGLRERVRARIDPIPESLSSLVDQPEDVWAVMDTARNRIAHGSDNQPTSAQLAALTRLAHTVAIGAALNLLGVPDTVLCAAIDQSQWPVI
jgi:ApeA N-terminal domain 1